MCLEIHELVVAVDAATNAKDSVSTEQSSQKTVIQGLNLIIRPGEIHAIMGPNGSGKSTLANFLAGKSGYRKLAGQVRYQGAALDELTPELRARAGLFLAMQYPVEIPGVNNLIFLKTAVNAVRSAREQEPLDSADFLQLAQSAAAAVGLPDEFLQRGLNSGFSGGEKKRNEILQMLMLDPQLAILDEPDSGLDVDALDQVAHGINQFYNPTKALLIITHYPRILASVRPNYVHLFYNGKILESGDYGLAEKIEQLGYAKLINV